MDGDSSYTSYQRETRFQQVNTTLTVQTRAKIDVDEGFDDKPFRPSKFTVATKWVSTFIIGAMLLALLTLSKTSILALAERMTNPAKDDDPGGGGESEDTKVSPAQIRPFIVLLIMTLIPHCLNLVRAIRAAGFRRDLPWPERKSFLVGFLISVLESTGLCLFVYQIPTLMKPQFVPLVMNWVFIIPICTNVYKSIRQEDTSVLRSQFPIALACEIIGFCVSVAAIAVDGHGGAKILLLPVAVICLSISWTPEVQAHLLCIETPEEDPECPDAGPPEGSYQYQYTNGSCSTGSPDDDGDRLTHWDDIDDIDGIDCKDTVALSCKEIQVKQTSLPTWKLTIYMSAVKIVMTLVISSLLYGYILFDFHSFDEAWGGIKSAMDLTKLTDGEKFHVVSNSVGSFLGYLIGYMACTTCMQKGGFAIPLFLATPLAVVLLSVRSSCNWILIEGGGASSCDANQTPSLVAATLFLVLAQILSTGWLVFRSQVSVMQKEYQIFWLPTYNNVLLEQWVLLARRNEHNDDQHMELLERAKRSKVVICTTMYRESKDEMSQLLQSIFRLNSAQCQGERHFESHIIFDGAVKDRQPNDFVLQLVSLVETSLGVKPAECCKTLTPYGMTLSWRLPGARGMFFKIHLKDNLKVKNKKRWSQIMYMSYVLDYLMHQMDNATEEETYILTTDADVQFNADNVEALMDLMTRDPSVGAVCARTHPMGSGPLVWYQVFEYALGHWFQKAAEHVVGSVLCSPGCFSVYRCKALRDILPKYATNVEHAFDFLTKDMGEDRWLCTLMVQSGWRIEYCAASKNSTFCPEEFEEFYKQRRRWVASTLANIMLLLREWRTVVKFNHRLSIVFLLYQTALLFATLIGPSSVMLVVSGGLVYGWDIDGITTIAMQVTVCLGYGLVCLYTSAKTQLNTAKILSFFYAIVMTAVLVGTTVQIVDDIAHQTKGDIGNISFPDGSKTIDEDVKYSTTTIYLGLISALTVGTGLLHTQEVFVLVHGLWYLLCLPSAYLLLMIYSVCNITDRSWGTREEHKALGSSSNTTWKDTFKSIFFCCFEEKESDNLLPSEVVTQGQTKKKRTTSSSESEARCQDAQQSSAGGAKKSESRRSNADDSTTRPSTIDLRIRNISDLAHRGKDDDEGDEMEIKDVKDWLTKEMQVYEDNFRSNGYENTMLISGMTEKELKEIGIKTKGLRKFLADEIKRIPDFEIQAEVPVNVDIWLHTIGLPQYKKNFRHEQIFTSKDMEVLKVFGSNEIEKELKITKKGHIKRLLMAIGKLRNPTPDERRLLETRRLLELATVHNLKQVTPEEFEFWERLMKHCLFPDSKAFGTEEALKVKLGDLRNTWLVIVAVTNVLWIILIATLANEGALLQVAGSNPVGLVVVILFSFVLIVQFITMLLHRLETLIHYLGRSPYRYGQAYNTSWAFSDSKLQRVLPSNMADEDDDDAAMTVAETRRQAKKRLSKNYRKKIIKLDIPDPQETMNFLPEPTDY